MALKKGKRQNLFTKYYLLFVAVLSITLIVMGSVLITIVNAYSLSEKTDLLSENVKSLAKTISQNMIVNNMNSEYSSDKEAICENLSMVSGCIDADVFVCDAGGSVIMCKDQIGLKGFVTGNMVCKNHKNFVIGDKQLQRVYEGASVSKAIINGESYYVVGTAIKSSFDAYHLSDNNKIIGSVFAVTPTGTQGVVSLVIRSFLIIGVLCLAFASILIWSLTKRMVTPLQQMSAAAKRFAMGDFSYRVNVNTNDELADLGYAFNDMADALDKLESSRRSFVANVSHELKTPMTSIAGFIDGILDGTIPKDKEEYYLKIVSDEVRRLSRLVVAMLNMSKIESGDFQMKPKSYNLSDQIIHILLTFEQKIEKKNIEIRGLEDLEPHHIVADTDMIYQVIYNLFDNAVKFTNDNGYIQINVSDIGDSVQVSIKNSGDGIDASELSRVFERFYKVDKSRSLDAKGAGLGLYIVKTMVEMHGGRIFARSDSKSEAEFVFTLPKSK
ncbi:HAMP domain-containing sensor histidine kinase [uncultured Eubacterium sp.]|uniref:HAMP domain-containing sensor histidine kinase n=1 Tax=uncultured Eubacterium sp. TaxID=165185 RepID=UPI0015BB57BB|nr:HAMP domain-containing sensor histidine kinase [uncultured Eubacterium sp.]